MAKRRAEAVACCAPCYVARAPPSKRSRSDLERRELRWATLRSEEGGGNKKRKWMEAAQAQEGEETNASAKRPVRLKGSGSPKEPERGLKEGTARQAPQQRPLLLSGMETEAAASRGDESSGRGRTEEHEDDVWDYNSFQYWRLPLPTLNLSDIEELEKDTTTEARSSNSIGLSEMET